MIVRYNNEKPIKEKVHKSRFIEALRYLHSIYAKFPKFMIEIMAENFGVLSPEVKELISRFKKSGFLILVKNKGYCYQLNEEV